MGSQTVGYRYYMGLFFGICHGPVDALRRVLWGDRTAWAGDQAETGPITLNEPELFGGDEREGGIVGQAHLLMGDAAQTLPSAVSALLPSPAPAFRGVASLMYDGQITANNPYVKPIGFKVQRIFAGWEGGTPWYPEKAAIGEITPGDTALTLLQSRFLGGSAEDESAYRVAGPTQNGGLVQDGEFVVNRNHADDPFKPSVLEWQGVAPSGSGAVTVEAIVQWAATPNVTLTAVLSVNPMDPSLDATFAPFIGYYAEAGVMRAGRVGSPDGLTGGPALGLTHIAIVITDSEVRYYVGGSLIATHVATAPSINTLPLRVRVGDPYGYSGGTTQYTVFGFRVVNDEIYTGSSFTPPTSIPDPDTSSASTGNLLMNPAHMIYQCLTDTTWGMGYPTAVIDSASFTAAADTLYGEDFGLCMLWNQQEEIGQFVRRVLDHIGAVLYTDPSTGKFSLRLLRADYDPDTLDVFDESTIEVLDSFQRTGYGDTVNEITVKYRDVETNREASVTVHNLANIQAQGAVVAETRTYQGLPNDDLALRVAQRDLIAASTTLAKGKVRVNRKGWSKYPGDLFKLVWPKLGLDPVVVRIVGIDQGTLEAGTLTFDIIEDVFGLPASSYAAQEPPGWQEPVITPEPITTQDIIEAPYLDLVLEMSAAELAAVDEDAAFLCALAARPNARAQSFEIYSRVGSAAFADRAPGAFVPYAELDGAIGHTETTIPIAAAVDLSLVQTGSLAIIGAGRTAEWVRVDSVDTATPALTVSRGMLDTVPAPHADGSAVWFDDGRSAPEYIERATGEEVDFRLLTRTTSGLLPLSQASEVSATADQRQARPYAPGRLRINGDAYPAAAEDALTITWAHRDRLQQTTTAYVDQAAASVGPEDGVTYSAELRNVDADSVVATATGMVGASWEPEIQQGGAYTMRLRLWAERGGLESWQEHDFEFSYTGDGLAIEAPGRTGSMSASLVFPDSPASVAVSITQVAITASDAAPAIWRLRPAHLGPGGGNVVSGPASLSASFSLWPDGYDETTVIVGHQATYQLLAGDSDPIAAALDGFALVARSNASLSALTIASYVIGPGGPNYVEVIGPVGQDWRVVGSRPASSPAAAQWGLIDEAVQYGGPARAGQPQISTATVSGSPDPGDKVVVSLGGQAFSYLARPGDTAADVASGLAALIDLDSAYSATSDGAAVAITGAVGAAYAITAYAEGAHAYGNFFGGIAASLLLHFDGDFSDSSVNNRTPTTHGGAATGSTNAAFGEAFQGTGASWVSFDDHPSTRFGAGLMSMDCRVYIPTSTTLGTDNVLAAQWGAGGGDLSCLFGINSAGKPYLLYSTDGSNIGGDYATVTVPRDQPVHVAVWRYDPGLGGNTVLYFAVDGVVDTGTYSHLGSISNHEAFFGCDTDFTIGATETGGGAIPAGMVVDEMRVCKGAQVPYGNVNFTPPPAAYA